MSRFAKMKEGLWPAISDIETAHKASKQGFWAATISAGFTLLVVAANLAGADIFNLDIWSLLDVAIFILVAIGIRKKIKVAPIVGLVVYSFSQVIMMAEHGRTNFVMLIIFCLMYINSYRGIISWHKFKKAAGPTHNSKQRKFDVLGFVGIAIFVVLLLMGMNSNEDLDLPTIYNWSDVASETATSLGERNVYSVDERPVYLYVDSPEDSLASGIIVTDQRMTIFGLEEGEFKTWPIHLSRIKKIEKIGQSSFFDTTKHQFTVDLDSNDTVIEFEFPSEKGLDNKLIAYLKGMSSKWRQ